MERLVRCLNQSEHLVKRGYDRLEQSKIEETMLNHGLGYMMRVHIPALGIEHDPANMKEFLWDYVKKLVDESNKLNLKWSHMDIIMQVNQKRPSDYYDSLAGSKMEEQLNEKSRR